jgi:hypothetical protein
VISQLASDVFYRELASWHAESCSVIYVSTDTSPKAVEAILSGQAFLRMTFNDSSDFAPMVTFKEEQEAKKGKGKGREGVEMEEVARGEEFIVAGVSWFFPSGDGWRAYVF